MIKQIYICDKCGKEEILNISPRGHENISIGAYYDDKDLCYECQRSLDNVIAIAIKKWWGNNNEQHG